MRIFITRTRMAGMENRSFSYDVYVPIDDVPHKSTVTYMSIVHNPDGESIKAVSFAEATRPEQQRLMSPSFDKLAAWDTHEAEAREIAWYMVKQIFDETRDLSTNTLPLLWATFNSPMSLNHATRWYHA